MTNIDPFFDWTTLKCDCIVRMYLENRKGASCDEIEFMVSVGYLDESLLSNLEFVANTLAVGAYESSINEGLAILCEREYVCNERNVEEHVSVENEGTRGKISKSGDWVASKSMHGGADCFIDKLLCILFVCRGLEVDECANYLANCFM